MANTRISQLAGLAGADAAADDVLPIVDTSAAATKKISVSEAKIALGVAALELAFANPTLTAIADGSLGSFSHRNKIINGKMEIAQRGTSFPAAVSGTYTADRWVVSQGSGAILTVDRQTDVPSNNEFQHSLRATVTTADTSIAASEYFVLQQHIEGYNVRDLIGRTFTLSFWVRSSKTGTHCVSFTNSTGDLSYVVEYSITAANTWEKKSVTVLGGLITTGTWNWTNGAGLNVRFTLAAGSTFQTTKDTWQTGNYLATANQVNCLDTVGNIFAITGVQLEVGTVATPFEHRPIGTELALCQRYTWPLMSAHGIVGNGTTSAWRITSQCPVGMRASPTLTLVGSLSVQPGSAGSVALSSIGANYSTSSFVQFDCAIGTHGSTPGHAVEIIDGSSTNHILVVSEL
jgi:hypothetical protein